MNKTAAIILALIITLCGCSNGTSNPEVKQSLASMNKALANRDESIRKRELIEDSLRARLYTLEDVEQLKAAQELAFRFAAVNVDSAIKYYTFAKDLALKMNNESTALQCKAHTLSMSTFLGNLYKAAEQFEKIDTTKMTMEDLREYYAAGSRLYLSYANYVSSNQAGSSLDKGIACTKRHQELSKKDTPEYNYVEAVISEFDGRHARAIALASDALENNPEGSVYNTWCEELLGAVYLRENKKDEAIIHFSKAVKNDAEHGFQIGNGARLLANIMIHDGDFIQADRLLQASLIKAVNAGDKMRFSQAVTLSPEITEQFRGNNNTAHTIITTLITLLTGSLAIIGWLIHKRCCDRNKTDILNKKIKELAAEKTTYIREFLNMSAMYLEKIDEYKTDVQKKIKSGKLNDVISALKTGEIFQSQSETFYSIFDRAFIHAYPDFVKDVNNLLQPDKSLIQSLPDSLTTDLRLLAFMRLGFDDSSLIARFMGLSLNTIYTYRNRIRSRAINRDTFERDITKIGV